MFIALINFSVVFWRAVVLGSFGQHNKNWNGSCLELSGIALKFQEL